MKVNRTSPFFLIPFALLLLCRCDTSRNVDSPVNSYFLKYFGNDGDQTGVDFEVNPDGTFILFGTTKKRPTDTTQLYVVKADAQGNFLWERKMRGPLDEEAIDIELTSDGRIAILANSYQSGSITSGGSRDILLMTLTPDGKTIDSVLYGYTNVLTGQPADEDATSITQTNDGFIVAGSTENLTHPEDINVNFFKRFALGLRVNDDLTKYAATWTDPPVYGQGSENVSTKIFQLPDNSFYVLGYSKWVQGLGTQNDFNIWYFSLGSVGGVSNLATGSFGSPNTDEKLESAAEIPPQLGGGYFLGGLVTDQAGNDDGYFMRLRSPFSFDASDAIFGPSSLGNNLGQLKNKRVSVCVSQTSGYFVLTNETTTGNDNFFLMKIGDDGKKTAWSTQVIYGGPGDDFVGSVHELPDGKIVIFGTMSIGQQNGETKMVLIKVNKDGKFAD